MSEETMSNHDNLEKIAGLLGEILANQEETNVRIGAISSNLEALERKISRSDGEIIKLNVVLNDLKSSVMALEDLAETVELIQKKLG